MTVDDILKLVNAGFNKDEIISLASPVKAENRPAEEAKAEVDANIQAEPEKPAEAPTEPNAAIPEALAAALENINNTLAKLQTFAIKTDAQPEPAKTDDVTAILGSIINRKE